MIDREVLEVKFREAKKGRMLWNKVKMENHISDNSYVFIFPEKDTACGTYVLKYLPDFIKQNNCKQVFLIAFDESVSELKLESDCEVNVVRLEKEQIEQIIIFYTFQRFSDKIIIANLKIPEGRNADKIIGVKEITEEEIVALALLKLDVKCIERTR